jgi:hypothetical protein
MRLPKLEKPFRISIADLLFIRGTERRVIEECPTLFVRAVGIIDREDDTISTHRLQYEQKRRIGEEAAGRDENMLQKVVGRTPLTGGRTSH